MNALYGEFKARGLVLLLVNMGEDPDVVRTVYLIDRQARIVGRAIGRRDWAGEAGRRLIATLLQPGASPGPASR